MEIFTDGDLTICKAGPAGFGNNIYLVVDNVRKVSAFIDAPDEVEQSYAVVEEIGIKPSYILLTHSHPDHVASVVSLKDKYGCQLIADPKEPWIPEGTLDREINGGDTVEIGDLKFMVLSIPGHTPASTAFVYGNHAFVGDTLFPGGPGNSRSNADLRREIKSIKTQLYTLPVDTIVWPGHGENTTIGVSIEEYAIFESQQHAEDLHGDVSWLARS
jgi:glyoxylase-like metal-dependent hydrolase (beta-lactamase superfamily II)|tara:strand:+ start:145 stop:792 length:648 start_codon:yes stop_codon:yes gene_type:complete